MAQQPLGALIQLLKAETILSPAQIATLSSIGAIVVPAPGAGKMIVPIAVFLNHEAGSAPYYAAADIIDLEYRNDWR